MKNVITSKKTKTQNLNLMCNVLFMNRGGSDQVRVHQAFYIQKTKGLNRTEYQPGGPCQSNDSSQDLFCWESGWKFDDYESVKQ